MKRFKGIVKDKVTKKTVIIESEANTKADFINDLRQNGYAVCAYKVKEANVFDYIMEYTNCYSWDWKEINKVPEEIKLP